MSNTNASRACTKYEAAYKLATIAHVERDVIDSCFSTEWKSAHAKCKALYTAAAAIKPGNRNHRIHEIEGSRAPTWKDLHG